VCHNNGHC